MNPNKRFEVMYLEEAIKFLNTLDVKVKDKILRVSSFASQF